MAPKTLCHTLVEMICKAVVDTLTVAQWFTVPPVSICRNELRDQLLQDEACEGRNRPGDIDKLRSLFEHVVHMPPSIFKLFCLVDGLIHS